MYTYHTIPYHTIPYHDMTWHDMTWHDMTLHYITLHIYIYIYIVHMYNDTYVYIKIYIYICIISVHIHVRDVYIYVCVYCIHIIHKCTMMYSWSMYWSIDPWHFYASGCWVAPSRAASSSASRCSANAPRSRGSPGWQFMDPIAAVAPCEAGGSPNSWKLRSGIQLTNCPRACNKFMYRTSHGKSHEMPCASSFSVTRRRRPGSLMCAPSNWVSRHSIRSFFSLEKSSQHQHCFQVHVKSRHRAGRSASN